MSEPKQLNQTQLKVVEDLASGKEVEWILKTHHITTKTFYKWLTGEAFARQMRLRRQVTRYQSQLHLADSVYAAAKKLVELTKDDKPDVARRACLDVLELAHQELPPMYEPPRPPRSPLDRETAGRMLDVLTGETGDR